MDSLSQFASWLASNPWFSIIGYFITILSLILAIIFYTRSKKLKLPCYSIRSTNIVRNLVSRIESLEMLYAGQKIENITATKIVIWNVGNETIHRHDIASADPPTIRVSEEYKILNAQIISVTNPANKFLLTLNHQNSQYIIDFEYLDHHEGAVFQVLHTGRSSKDVIIQGTIKGAGKMMRRTTAPGVSRIFSVVLAIMPFTFSRVSRSSQRRLVLVALVVIPIFFAAFTLRGLLLPRTGSTPQPGQNELVAFVVLNALMVIPYWGLGYSIFARQLPKGLDAFEEDF